MTHDLIKNVLTGLETQVHKVVVTELREDTFYAVALAPCGMASYLAVLPMRQTICFPRSFFRS
jgi:hypothetical protein